ncbi:hypothetical protein Tco_1451404 [Tanacetum coccineum]
MDENAIRLLLKEHSDAFTSRLIAIQTELEATKNLVHARHGGGGDQGSMIPRAMRLDMPKFTGTYPNSEAAEWFRWMSRNKLINGWDKFLESERIEKTKRSKNYQKPTRNEKKTKSQEQDKEFSQRSQPDQPDSVKERNNEVKDPR